MNIYKIGLILSIMLTGLCGTLNAQEATTPEKQALIKELLTVTDSKKNANEIRDAMYSQIEKLLPDLLSQQILNDERLSAADREALQKYMNEAAPRIFKRFRELIDQRVNFSQLIEDMSLELYDKYFTESEIKDLIAFYKTTTGQKTLSVLPKLLAESMQMTSAALKPHLHQVMMQVMDEEKKHLPKH
jgi:hypothetical protein